MNVFPFVVLLAPYPGIPAFASTNKPLDFLNPRGGKRSMGVGCEVLKPNHADRHCMKCENSLSKGFGYVVAL